MMFICQYYMMFFSDGTALVAMFISIERVVVWLYSPTLWINGVTDLSVFTCIKLFI